MITIKIKGPNSPEGFSSSAETAFSVIKPKLWIGRGEDVLEKEGMQGFALNLGPYSKAVSRLHACLVFSPAFFAKSPNDLPSFLRKLGKGWGTLNEATLKEIWQFTRPAKRILLRDLQSKAGIYRKVVNEPLFPGMTVVLGDSRPITFHHKEMYDSALMLSMRLEQLCKQGFSMLNEGADAQSFWLLSYRSSNYVLLESPSSPLLIGRSSDCHLVIPEPTISRRHALLRFDQTQWLISDGDGTHPSSNGVWLKVRKLWVDFQDTEQAKGEEKEGQLTRGESKCKIGDILLNFSIRPQSDLVHIEECVSFNRSTDGSLLEVWRKEGDLEVPQLQKHRSQL